MLMRQLVGRNAGDIIDVPFSVAEANLASGTMAKVTEDEVAAAGVRSMAPLLPPEQAPEGYRIDIDHESQAGFNVFDPGGVPLTKQPLPNLAAARDFARRHAAEQIGMDPDELDMEDQSADAPKRRGRRPRVQPADDAAETHLPVMTTASVQSSPAAPGPVAPPATRTAPPATTTPTTPPAKP